MAPPANRKTRRAHYSSRVVKYNCSKDQSQLAASVELGGVAQCDPAMMGTSSIERQLMFTQPADQEGNIHESSGDGCSTPRGRRHRIPDIVTCPRAPKKPRVSLRCSSGRKIAFFSPPELEVFFFFALRGVLV